MKVLPQKNVGTEKRFDGVEDRWIARKPVGKGQHEVRLRKIVQLGMAAFQFLQFVAPA
jgi:hypothetical protein